MEASQQDIARMLRQTLEGARSDYAAVVRTTHWGEGPIYLSGCGAAAHASLAGAYAFEALLGWPAVSRPAKVFDLYSSSVLRPRSVLLLISASGESPEQLELAGKAQAHGATVLALCNNPSSSLAKAAQAVFLTRAEGAGDTAAMVVCQHAALAYLAFVAASILKRPNPLVQALEAEFQELPGNIEWSFTQLSDAVRALASELAGSGECCVVGGGFYHAPALRGARRLKEVGGIHAEGIEACEFASLGGNKRQGAALFLSGSRSKLKKTIHEAAAQARIGGGRVLSITDGNDRELADRSDVGVLIPSMTEVTGSILTLALLEPLALQAARLSGRDTRPSP